jgi:hypothetical protein
MAHVLRFVIPDGRSSVLLVADGAGHALPRVTSAEPEVVIDVAPALRPLVGGDVVVLRDVRVGPAPVEDAIAYVTEAAPDRVGDAGRWSTRADLDTLKFSDPKDREILATWFDGDGPAALQPWQRPGWFASASAWIDAVLPGVSEIRQYASWCNSCVLRVTIRGGGRAWCKAVHAAWAREPGVTAMLGDLLPGRTPQVLATDTERGWMLLGDVDGVPADTLPADARLGALEATGRIHREAVGLTDTLLRGGCADRRPEVLAGQIEDLAAEHEGPLPGALAERLRAAVPRLQDLCARMRAAPIPTTLVHGDLHAGNIMRTGGDWVVFDWSDACIADPFVDVVMFITRLTHDPAVRAAFRDRYLGAWPDLAPADAADYVALAEPLAAMHHAITYRAIRDAFDPYDYALFEGALPRWVEHALACPAVAG